jgi:protein phosphatase
MDENDGSVSSQPKPNPSEKNVLVEEVEVNGDIPQARFGHTVTIVAKNKVVLFGGATGDTVKYSMTGDTFIFNVLGKNWQKL